jgi:hypothetical protein
LFVEQSLLIAPLRCFLLEDNDTNNNDVDDAKEEEEMTMVDDFFADAAATTTTEAIALITTNDILLIVLLVCYLYHYNKNTHGQPWTAMDVPASHEKSGSPKGGFISFWRVHLGPTAPPKVSLSAYIKI